MANINEILARAAALRDETALNSISPERAGGIMYDTLLALNELWLQQGAALVISKIYASVAAMEADTAPVSDLTGKPLRPGQIVVIASSDSDNGSVYRYNGTESPSWSLVGSIGNLDPVDSLDSDSITLPLAAHQGKVLDGKISQLGQNSVFDQTTILQKRASYYKQYDCEVGQKYIFKNIGDALVNVYYSTTGDDSGAVLIKQLTAGESYLYTPEVNSGYIYNSTSDISITKGRVAVLEQEVVPLADDIEGIKGELATNKDLFTKLTKDGENKGNWLNGVYLNSSKAYAGNSAWKVGIFTISEKVKYLILDVDCTGGATYTFLEDGDGNTLKSWHSEMIKEVISIADYPTAATLRVSYKSEYDGGIVLLENGELERAVYDLLYKDAPGQWQDGFYNSEKELSANSGWEAFQFWFNNKDVRKIRVMVDCSSTTAFCYLLDESWNILKSWNSANFIETITIADYPSARLLLVSNRKSNTSRAVRVWYEKNVAELNSELNNEVTNYKMRSIVPVKIKSTDNVLFVGDSVAYGQGAGSSSNRWVDRVCAAIGCSFTNDSEPGAAFSEGRIISHINNKDLTQFSYIVIAAGINDCNRGYTKTQIQNAVGAICDYINAYAGFNGKVLFVTPANEYRPQDTRAIYSVEQVRRIIYDKVASYGNFYLLDGGGIPFSNIIGDATNALLVTYQSDGVTFDGLHPNANGHLMYANYFLTNCANL